MLLIDPHHRTTTRARSSQYFEVLKEKAPELVIPFDEHPGRRPGLRATSASTSGPTSSGAAIAEASYLEDARVGEVLRQRGKTLEGIAYLLDLWREYPGTASIQSDFFGLSQVLARLAGRAIDRPGRCASELAAAGRHAVRPAPAGDPPDPGLPVAVARRTRWPTRRAWPWSAPSSSWRTSRRSSSWRARFAELYPKSTFLDSFQYSEALGRFHLGEYDRAIEVAEAIAAATYKDANGVDQPSPNKWQALYILGQIHDARRQPGEALAYYEQVADRFTDAAGAVKALTRKELKLPEVSVVRPAGPAGGGRGAASASAPSPRESPQDVDAKPSVTLDYRNIAEADVKVYPVDLMRLYLTRRNLDAIAGIDLAGITPLLETTSSSATGADFDDKTRRSTCR